MMTFEQQLVQQIRDFIRADKQDNTLALQDMAEQYADICLDINTRLNKCSKYIDQGMRSEAMHEAQVDPALLDLADIINFQEVKKWRNIVEDFKLTPFPPLELTILERIEDEMQVEEKLAPYLKEYRRYVHSGNKEECLRLLHRIQKLDSDNPVWKENIRSLETSGLDDLLDEIEEALEKQDLETLKKIDEILTSPQRLVPIPDDLRLQMDEILGREVRKKLSIEARTLVIDLQDEFTNQNYAKVGILLERWQELEKEKLFRPTTDMLEAVNKATNWYSTIKKSKDEAEAHHQAAANMQNHLKSNEATEDSIKSKWSTLQAAGGALPENLEQSVIDTLNKFKKRRNSKRNKIMTLAASLLVVLAIGALIFVQKANQEKKVTRFLNGYTKTEALNDILALKKYVDKFRNGNPALARKDKVANLLQNFDIKYLEYEKQIRAFKLIMSELSSIRLSNYNSPNNHIQGLLDDAQKLAVDDDTKKRLATWERTWEQWKTKTHDQRVQQAIGILDNATLLLRKLDNETSLANKKDILNDLQIKGDDLQKISLQDIDKKLKDRVVAMIGKITSKVQKIKDQTITNQNNEERYRNLLTEMQTIPASVVAYEKLYKTFIREFPQDPLVAGFKKALSKMAIYKAVESIKNYQINDFPLSEVVVKRLKDDIVKLQNTPWNKDLHRIISLHNYIEQLKKKIPFIVINAEKMLNVKEIRYRPKFLKKGETEKKWQTIYTDGVWLKKRKKSLKGNSYDLYWGNMYDPANEESNGILTHSSDHFLNGLNSLKYEIDIKNMTEEFKLEYAQYIYSFVANMVVHNNLEDYLFVSLKILQTNKTMRTIPKVWIMQQLIVMLNTYYSEESSELRKMKKDIMEIKTNISWLMTDCETYKKEEKKALEILKNIPSIEQVRSTLSLNRKFLLLSVNRHLQCVGAYLPNHRKEYKLCIHTGRETAWLMDKRPGTISFTPAIFSSLGGWKFIDKSQKANAFGGMLFFAPGDKKSEKELLQELLKGTKYTPKLITPSSWPSKT